QLIHRIDFGAIAYDVATTNDLGAAFVATSKGIAVVDTLALQQFDANPDVEGINMIPVPGGAVTALAVDPANRYLYAAALGKVYVINIDPGKPNYLKVLPYGSNMLDVHVEHNGQDYGHITSMALNADGTRLYVGVPVSEMFGANGWVNAGQAIPGKIKVINVDEKERPAQAQPNTHRWRTVIAEISGGVEVFDIQPTSDSKIMVFAARGD